MKKDHDKALEDKRLAVRKMLRAESDEASLRTTLDNAKQKLNDLSRTLKNRDALLKRRAEEIELLTDKVEAMSDSNAQIDNLRLTLDEKNTYIAEIEQSIERRDTENALLRLEVESLTLWRENQNQQLRTEADIAAARSRALIRRDTARVLENLSDQDNR